MFSHKVTVIGHSIKIYINVSGALSHFQQSKDNEAPILFKQ